jgi:hypothetical protein
MRERTLNYMQEGCEDPCTWCIGSYGFCLKRLFEQELDVGYV